ILRDASQVEPGCAPDLFGADRPNHGRDLRSDHRAGRLPHRAGLPRAPAAHPLQGCRDRQDAGVPHNQLALPALTICALYKSRWRVELFFKWIKQHLRIKQFYGTSENAVKTQVWCAVATYVLIAIVKKELQLDASLYTCLQILSVSVFEKTQVSCALQHDRSQSESPDPVT